jgi:hypothetical protein
MEQRMGYLIAMLEEITAKVEADTNACRDAVKACLEKMKAETDAIERR